MKKAQKPLYNCKNRGGVALKTLSAALLAGCVTIGAPALADETIPGSTRTLGENSAYRLTPATEETENSLTLFALQKETKTIEYTDVSGSTQSFEYQTLTATPKNYNLEYNIPTPTANRINLSNNGVMGDLNEHFAGNVIDVSSGDQRGGAIYINSNGTVGNITGDFVENQTKTGGNHVWGGAVFNGKDSQISSITGDFIMNSAEATKGLANAGGIYNIGQIGKYDDNLNFLGGGISGIFIGNTAKTLGTHAYGGAISNESTSSMIGDISGIFINNSVTSPNFSYGGAIYNSGKIESIHADFINNFVQGELRAAGGAIYSQQGVIGSINGNFINNHIETSAYAIVGGGAIFANSTTIESIDANFVNNYVKSNNPGLSIYAGAFAGINGTKINGNFNGNFIGNYISTPAVGRGGAVFQANVDGNINGNYVGNYVLASSAYGGAIALSFANKITGNFINNYVIGEHDARGGALYATAQIKEVINGTFIGNYAKTTNTEKNGVWGGAIFLHDTGEYRPNITGDFINNYADSGYAAYGGVIFNYLRSHLGVLKSNFINNYASGTSEVLGGVICNYASIEDIQGHFIGNYAKTSSEDFYALGGAVFTTKDMKFSADGSEEKTALSLFSGNYTSDSRGITPNAIYVRTNLEQPFQEDVTLTDGTIKNLTTGYTSDSTTTVITLNSVNGGLIQFDDQIDGGEIHSITAIDKDAGTSSTVGQTLTRDHQYDLHLTGDGTSQIVFNNAVRNANITMDNVTTTIRDAQNLNFAQGAGINSLTLNSGTLNFLTMGSTPLELQSLNLNGGTINILNSDVDFQNKTMGSLHSGEYGETNGTTINVSNLTITKDMKRGTNDVEISFVSPQYGDNVNYTGGRDLYSKILKYHARYNPSSGSFSFRRIGGVGGYNPAVLASSVAAQTGAYAAQTESFNYAFSHADGFMNNSNCTRFARQNSNRYALQDNTLLYAGSDTTDKSLFVQPYASFESINLKNGPKVSTISYGTFFGGHGDLQELKNGWATVTTAYVGYNGSSQSYSGINTYQNGGMLGATQTWYKGNFYTALTANVGASVGEANTQYGHDNFTMLMAGVASKTGYNYEFKEGRFIVQPSMLVGYSFINTFDYTSAAGVKMSHDPMNSIQLRPNLKFIANLKNGWQPYASVGVVWNILNDTKVSAEDITLPEMSIKPYVEYGVGVQKSWKDRFTGYAQAMLRSGGRNGIALTAGFRWALGKETPVKNEKVSAPQRKISCNASSSAKIGYSSSKAIIKQLSPAQKTALGYYSKDSTTRTTNAAMLKRL